ESSREVIGEHHISGSYHIQYYGAIRHSIPPMGYFKANFNEHHCFQIHWRKRDSRFSIAPVFYFDDDPTDAGYIDLDTKSANYFTVSESGMMIYTAFVDEVNEYCPAADVSDGDFKEFRYDPDRERVTILYHRRQYQLSPGKCIETHL
ncbi:hypothetical protein FOL47_001568, partial [Perkinsus chesapeaki]